MKSAVLNELVEKWKSEARETVPQDGSPEAAVSNALDDGYRNGVSRCADQLSVLVELLGD